MERFSFGGLSKASSKGLTLSAIEQYIQQYHKINGFDIRNLQFHGIVSLSIMFPGRNPCIHDSLSFLSLFFIIIWFPLVRETYFFVHITLWGLVTWSFNTILNFHKILSDKSLIYLTNSFFLKPHVNVELFQSLKCSDILFPIDLKAKCLRCCMFSTPALFSSLRSLNS